MVTEFVLECSPTQVKNILGNLSTACNVFLARYALIGAIIPQQLHQDKSFVFGSSNHTSGLYAARCRLHPGAAQLSAG